MSQFRCCFGLIGAVVMLVATVPVVAEPAAEAEPRLDVLERIKPVGEVSVAGQPTPIPLAGTESAPAATESAAESAPADAAAEATSVPAAAEAPAAAPADGGALYAAKGCAACHGPNGNKTLMPAYPKIAGQASGYLVAQMKDIKSGARANGQTAIMKGTIDQVSDAEIEAIAGWLSSQ
jgi:cytochrome c